MPKTKKAEKLDESSDSDSGPEDVSANVGCGGSEDYNFIASFSA